MRAGQGEGGRGGPSSTSEGRVDRDGPAPNGRCVRVAPSRSRQRWFLPGSMAAIVVIVLLISLPRCTPAWWNPPAPGSSRADEHARALEQGIASEFTRIRPEGERWAVRIRAEDANAWLALRLPRWLEHDRELPWPEGVEVVQVDFAAPDRVTLGVRRDRLIWTVSMKPTLQEGRLSLVPLGAGVGRLWLPMAIAFGGEGGAAPVTAFVPELARPVEAMLPLPDGRRVRLLDYECDSGELRLRLQTLPRVRGAREPEPSADRSVR